MSASRTRLIPLFVAGLAFVAGAAIAPRITRSSLQTLEHSSDASFEGLLKEDPMSILGSTRAVYLDGYGVVFSTEVDLAPRLAPNPFRPPFTKQDIARNKETKRARVSLLKDHMRSMLVDFAGKLDTVPGSDNVALAVSIPYSKSEDADGLPRQIVMMAPRRALLAGDQASNSNVKTQEFY